MSELKLNLLPNQAKFQAKRIYLRRLTSRYIRMLLAVVSVVSLLIFGIYLGTRWRVEAKEKKIKVLGSEVTGLSERATTSWRLKYIAGMVASALKTRFEYGTAFDLISNLLPDSIGVEEVELRENSTFYVSGKTPDSTVIDVLEEKLRLMAEGGVEGFSGGEFTNLSYQGTLWSYSLEVKLK